MLKSTFVIDPDLSIEKGCLVISGNLPKTFPFKIEKGMAVIPPQKTKEALTLLASLGNLSYKGKILAIDLFTEAKFSFVCHKGESDSLLVSGYLFSSGKKISLTTIDFLFQGPPHGFIAGISLKFIQRQVPFKWLKLLHEGKSVSLDQVKHLEETSIEYDADALILKDHLDEPSPILILKDALGCFADLAMAYPKKRVSYHDPLEGAAWRNRPLETAWEKDLIEAGYQKKVHEGAHFFCPTDKVTTTLQLLLEIGWKVLDRQGRELFVPSHCPLTIESAGSNIRIKGDISFGNHSATCTSVLAQAKSGARFFSLSDSAVGLLPQKWEDSALQVLLERGECVQEGILIKKTSFSLIDALVRGSSCQSLVTALPKEAPHTPPESTFLATLRPYQQEGLNWLASLFRHGWHALLADDMGLGKTVQVIAFFSWLYQQKRDPSLIVVPASLLFHWKKEIEKFLKGAKVCVYWGQKRAIDPKASFIVTTYAILRQDVTLLQQLSFTCLVLDEAQTIKNSASQSFAAACALSALFRLSLTGTPIENRLDELWTHFHFLIPELFPNLSTFLTYPRGQLKQEIAPYFLRRKKEEVAKDLPPKVEEVIWVEMEELQKRTYFSYLHGIKSGLLKKVSLDGASVHRIEILEAILRLRQLACHPLLLSQEGGSGKMEQLIDDLLIMKEEERKVLIFSQFTAVLDLLANSFTNKEWKFSRLDGQTKDRESQITRFQEHSDIPFFLISLKAGGVGLNLTSADTVCLFDPWWNVAAENQAIDRAHRIGQTKTVFARRYIALGTIEEKIMLLKEAKSSLIEDLFSNEAHFQERTEELLALLKD